jgi:hypothetical protein
LTARCAGWLACWTLGGLRAIRASEMAIRGINNRLRCMRVLLDECYRGGGELW